LVGRGVISKVSGGGGDPILTGVEGGAKEPDGIRLLTRSLPVDEVTEVARRRGEGCGGPTSIDDRRLFKDNSASLWTRCSFSSFEPSPPIELASDATMGAKKVVVGTCTAL